MSARWTQFLSLGLPIAAWAGMMQLGQILPEIDCTAHSYWLAIFSLASLSVGGAAVFFGLLQTRRATLGTHLDLTGYLFGLTGTCFVFVTALQGMAVWLVNPCAR
jgi:hypothetical protein